MSGMLLGGVRVTVVGVGVGGRGKKGGVGGDTSAVLLRCVGCWWYCSSPGAQGACSGP